MGRALSSKNWLLAALCNAIMLLAVCMTPSWAALLKDIRTGEYETYTRIVFELDAMVQKPVISQTAEQVQVVLPDTQPDMKRKLSLKGNRHLRDIKIQDIQPDKISITIHHDARILRISSFELHSPPRLVLDVHWVTIESALEPQETLLPNFVNQEPLFAAAASDASPSESTAPVPMPHSPSIENTPGHETFESEPLPFDAQLADLVVPSDDSTAPIDSQPAETLAPPVTSVHHFSAGPESHPFQVFLAIVLVTIIIAILVFMALMLLCRNHWIHFDDTAHVGDDIPSKAPYIAGHGTRAAENAKTL